MTPSDRNEGQRHDASGAATTAAGSLNTTLAQTALPADAQTVLLALASAHPSEHFEQRLLAGLANAAPVLASRPASTAGGAGFWRLAMGIPALACLTAAAIFFALHPAASTPDRAPASTADHALAHVPLETGSISPAPREIQSGQRTIASMSEAREAHPSGSSTFSSMNAAHTRPPEAALDVAYLPSQPAPRLPPTQDELRLRQLARSQSPTLLAALEPTRQLALQRTALNARQRVEASYLESLLAPLAAEAALNPQTTAATESTPQPTADTNLNPPEKP
jgi:hypothetical protein